MLIGVVSVFTLGCAGGQDPVAEGMAKFPLVRHDLEAARQLLLALKQADGITDFEVGPRYDERPDKVIFNDSRVVLYREVLSEKKIERQVELEQLERLGHRMPFNSIVLDADEAFRVSMYSGRNADLGMRSAMAFQDDSTLMGMVQANIVNLNTLLFRKLQDGTSINGIVNLPSHCAHLRRRGVMKSTRGGK